MSRSGFDFWDWRQWGELFKPVTASLGRTATATEALADERKSSVATVTQVSDSATSVQLLAAADDRLGAYFYNESTANARIKLGTTATAADYTVLLVPGAFYELPTPTYTGHIDCIWESAPGGFITITELGV